MAFQVPASEETDPKIETEFAFEIDGATFKVRRLNFVPIGQLEVVEYGGGQVDFFAGSTAKQGKAVRALNRTQFTALVEAWRADSEVTAGESQASAS